MLQEAQVACAHFGLQVGVRAEALLIRNLIPDQVEGVLRVLDVARWTRDIVPAVRLVASSLEANACLSAGDGSPTTELQLAFQQPEAGQEQYWVAFTRGEVWPRAVEQQLST
eukprot:4487102-Lingulodinium_polyedra.AAC.1